MVAPAGGASSVARAGKPARARDAAADRSSPDAASRYGRTEKPVFRASPLEVRTPIQQDTRPPDRTMEPLESAAALSFRPFEAGDLDVLERWLGDAGLRPSPRIRRDLRIRRLTDDDRIVTRLVDSDGEAVGFFRLDLAPDRSAELTLLVAAGRRRQGVGRRIVDQVVVEARDRGLVRLVAAVALDNHQAHEFFPELGFEQGDTTVPGFVHYERFLHRSDCSRPLEIRP